MSLCALERFSRFRSVRPSVPRRTLSRDATRRKEGREGSAGEFSFHHEINFFFLPPLDTFFFVTQLTMMKKDTTTSSKKGGKKKQKKDEDDEEEDVTRTSLEKIVNGGGDDDDVKNHDWEEQAIAYVKGGAVKEGQVKNVSVVTPQKMLKGIINILFVVGIYPCAKGHVYKNNPTTNAIERRVGAYFGGNFCVLFIDAVLFSANKKRINTKTFNPQKMLETLGANPALIKELFSRLCNQLRTWWLQGCAEVYKFPVCAIAGKDVERYAYEKWKEKNLIEEKERICHLDGLTVVLCWVRLGELGKEEEEEEEEKRREEKSSVYFGWRSSFSASSTRSRTSGEIRPRVPSESRSNGFFYGSRQNDNRRLFT